MLLEFEINVTNIDIPDNFFIGKKIGVFCLRLSRRSRFQRRNPRRNLSLSISLSSLPVDETDETDTKEAESDISANSISLSNIAPRRPFPTPSRYLLNAWLCTCSGSGIVNTAQQPAPLYLCPISSPLAAHLSPARYPIEQVVYYPCSSPYLTQAMLTKRRNITLSLSVVLFMTCATIYWR